MGKDTVKQEMKSSHKKSHQFNVLSLSFYRTCLVIVVLSVLSAVPAIRSPDGCSQKGSVEF